MNITSAGFPRIPRPGRIRHGWLVAWVLFGMLVGREFAARQKMTIEECANATVARADMMHGQCYCQCSVRGP